VSKSDRVTYRAYAYHAVCEDCGWSSEAKNAQGNAARHSDVYRHTVHVHVKGTVTYTPAGSPLHRSKPFG
jgi:hypothetical protein